MNTKKILLTVLLAVLLPVSSLVQVRADDTDIYLDPPSVARDDAPNILIILDNSGSMETNTVDVTAPYNAATTYSNTPGFDATKVYWSTSGTAPTSSSTTHVFSASNNSCAGSQAALAYGSSGDTGTGYVSDIMVMWHGSSSPQNWGTMLTSTDAQVACKGDSPTYGGTGPLDITSGTAGTILSGTPYVDKTNNATFTSSSNKEIDWGSYSSVTLYSGNYLNYKYGTSSTVTYTRMKVAKDAVDSLIDSNINVRIGMMVFNGNNSSPDGGRVVARISKLDDAWRTSLKATVAQVSGWIDPTGSTTSSSYSNMNYTPLSETLYEAYRYLSGKTVDYGGSNWDTGNSAGLTNYPRPFPDICAEDTSNSAYCAGYDYSTTTVSSINTWYGNVTKGTYISPFKYECQQAYVVIVTDGDPTNDTSAKTAIDTLNGGFNTTTNKPNVVYSTPTQGGDTGDTSDRLDDLAGYMYNNDLISDTTLSGTQRVLTYTVGFGNGISTSGLDLLKRTADAGHGAYYDATDANNLATALQSAIIDIQTTSSSFAAPSLSVNAFNKLYNGDDIYFALFKPSSTVEWDGNIKKLHLCNTSDVTTYKCTYGEIIDANGNPAIDPANLRIKDTSQSYWSTTTDGGTVTAGGVGDAITNQTPGGRTLYTYTGDYTTGLASEQTGFQITASSSGTMYTDATTDYTLLDSSGTISTLSTTTDKNNAVTNTINWMLGYNYGSSSVQRWPFSDPLHSRPVAITYGDIGGDTSKPITKLFVATNDGQIHMLNDSTGKEEWSFIPKELLGMQYKLSQDADGTHPYGADGTPTFLINDINNDGIIDPSVGDYVYMYIGMRRGGRNIYCFDVTPSSTLTSATSTFTPKLKWVIQGGTTTGYSRLGYTWSSPQVATIRTKCNLSGCNAGDSVATTVLLFGGGYNPGQDTGNFANTPSTDPYGADDGAVPSGMGNAIYIADPATGALIWDAGSDSSSTLVLSNMKYSIPSDLSLLDSDGDGAVDRIYVGDMGGQVWRVDLSSQIDTGANGTSTGFIFADLVCQWTGSSAPYTRDCSTTTLTSDQSWRKVFYPPDVVQMNDSYYSTNSTYDIVAVVTGNRADPIDWQTINAKEEAVHNRIYALRDYSPTKGTSSNSSKAPITADSTGTATGTLVDLTTDPVDAGVSVQSALQSSNGWYVDLKMPSGSGITVTPFTSPTITEWVGEKALAKPVIYDNVLYVTTYTPANEVTSTVTCAANEGLGKLYALNLLDASAAVDLNGDGTKDTSINVGGGIPSELVTVIREGGVTGLVGTSGGAASPNIGATLPRGRSYWYQG